MKLFQTLKILNNDELLEKFFTFMKSEETQQKELRTLLEENTTAAFLQKCVNVASTNRDVIIEMTKMDGTRIIVRTAQDRTRDGIREDLTPERAEQMLSQMAGSSKGALRYAS